MTQQKFNIYQQGLDLEFMRKYCMEHGTERTLKRGGTLEVEGKPSRWIGFVKRGCFKYIVYNKAENKDYITGFAFEREFVGDFPNCMTHQSASVSIVAQTTCNVQLIDGEELNRLIENNDHMKEQAGEIYKSLFVQIYAQYLDSYRMNVKERYMQLLRRCPLIVQQINLKDIASFLKVTPTTISKIRREITFTT